MQRPLTRVFSHLLDLYACAQFGYQHEIQNQRTCEQAVLAGVVHDNCVGSTHENLARVLVHRPLRVTDVRDVLDDDTVIRRLALLVQNLVRRNHVVNDAALGDFLGAERLRRTEVLTVVVAEVVVRHDADRLDASTDEKVDENTFHLRLPALEVVARDENAARHGEVNESRNEGVLRRSVDVRCVLKNACDGIQRRRRDLSLVAFNAREQSFLRSVQLVRHLAESFGVCRPQNNHLVQVSALLEVAYVLSNLFHLLFFRALYDVVGAFFLIRGDEVRVVDARHCRVVLKHRSELSLQIVVQHARPLHGVRHVGVGDIPARDLEVVRVHHGQKASERAVDLLSVHAPDVARTCLRERSVVVWFLHAVFGSPRDVVFVREHRSHHGRSVVSRKSNEQ
mmetsp:Transcript_2721/g.7422  ORF Transcript_2721/g.7422 Transcript_2721/m.7422 type:complete len:395 (+) Transcript_2721:172-1356(+)